MVDLIYVILVSTEQSKSFFFFKVEPFLKSSLIVFSGGRVSKNALIPVFLKCVFSSLLRFKRAYILGYIAIIICNRLCLNFFILSTFLRLWTLACECNIPNFDNADLRIVSYLFL